MRKIILSQPGCSKCKMLHDICPDTESVELPPAELIAFAKQLDIKSLPIVVLVGEQQELAEKLK